MKRKQPELSFEEITEQDIPELTGVMTRAFDDDAQKHRGLERGGPEGYDNGEFFRTWLFGYEQTVGYKAISQGQAIGGIIVWILEGGHNVVGTMFVEPQYQDCGVGTEIWRYIEDKYPETMSWRLLTPEWATKNHYFYEAKCGFQRVDSDPIVGEEEEGFIYRKEMGEMGDVGGLARD
jgi:GNAT superfamily N-acetyltransferase